MKILTTFGIFVIMPHIRRDLTDNPDRLKIIDTKVLYVSDSYINGNDYHITLTKENSNRNRLEVNCEVVQDFPLDTKLDVRVFRSINKNGPWKSLANYVSHICEKNDSYYKYRKYWSNLINKQTKDGKCIKKGKYVMKDASVFKFWNLLPKNETKGYYFMSRNALRTSEIIITISENRYESIES